jgi:hypothetical protein
MPGSQISRTSNDWKLGRECSGADLKRFEIGLNSDWWNWLGLATLAMNSGETWWQA